MNQNTYYHIALDNSTKLIAILTHQIPIFGTVIIVITLHVSEFFFEGCLRVVTKNIYLLCFTFCLALREYQ